MSQNILVLIRNEVQAVSEKLDNLASNLPNVDELNEKLDAQAAAVQAVQSDVTASNNKLDNIITILNPSVDKPVNGNTNKAKK
ncbi:P10 [Betabaculovirus altermyunipunctae]|uniref:P10 n=1 Tax=Betabaculovirus altermyunipunctae TaxID=3051996 RepID=A0A1S5YE50_9BBAC|nr:P10 [Betabaculovirus altermyunipunctae]AQQ80275.1 P10 [Betabaculovirus altermyunipunctae]